LLVPCGNPPCLGSHNHPCLHRLWVTQRPRRMRRLTLLQASLTLRTFAHTTAPLSAELREEAARGAVVELDDAGGYRRELLVTQHLRRMRRSKLLQASLTPRHFRPHNGPCLARNFEKKPPEGR
jgi:hypothetical protein